MRRPGALLVVLALLGWIAFLTITILSAPPTGAASAEELATSATAAMRADDAEALAALLAPPLDGDLAAAYVSALPPEVTVTVTGRRALVEGRGFGYPLAVVEADGRWYLSALPPL